MDLGSDSSLMDHLPTWKVAEGRRQLEYLFHSLTVDSNNKTKIGKEEGNEFQQMGGGGDSDNISDGDNDKSTDDLEGEGGNSESEDNKEDEEEDKDEDEDEDKDKDKDEDEDEDEEYLGESADFFKGASQICGKGRDILSEIAHGDEFNAERSKNPFYPFSCEMEWEVVSWLSRLPAPMRMIDEFFKLKYVCCSLYTVT